MSVSFLSGPDVKVDASANDWELFSDFDDSDPKLYSDAVSRESIAAALNAGLAELIKAAPNRKAFKWSAADALLGKFSEYGAADSEGYRMVEAILDKVYGES